MVYLLPVSAPRQQACSRRGKFPLLLNLSALLWRGKVEMATLIEILVRAVSDVKVALPSDTQHSIFALSAKSPELRAALAVREDLDPEVRSRLSEDASFECRHAFLSRMDLSESELAALVTKERRTTLLRSVAESSGSPEVLRSMAGKRGLGLQRAVALNPASPSDVRLEAAKFAFGGKDSLSYKDRSAVNAMLADSVAILSWVLRSGESPALLRSAVPFIPYADKEDADCALALAVDMLGDNVQGWRVGYGDNHELAEAVVRVAYVMEPGLLDRFRDIYAGVIKDMPDWRAHTMRANLSKLDASYVSSAASSAQAVRARLDLCRFSSNADEVERAAGELFGTSASMFGTDHAMATAAAVALMRNEATPLSVLHRAASVFGWNFSPMVVSRAAGSPRLVALMMSRGMPVPEKVLRSVEMSDVMDAAAAEGFWTKPLVLSLLDDPQLVSRVVAEVPVTFLPAEMPSHALGGFVSLLGDRAADPQWMEMALSLSGGWEGRLGELVDLADRI